MDRIISFDDFKKKSSELTEETEHMPDVHQEGEKKHYMFFQNLASIKHYIDEILTMDPEAVDAMLQDGHDWAADHIATSKDDVQEVAEWIRNAMEGGSEAMPTEPSGEPEEMIVNIEGSNNEVEVEKDEEDEEEEDEEEE